LEYGGNPLGIKGKKKKKSLSLHPFKKKKK
jgi:hypothetical protein